MKQAVTFFASLTLVLSATCDAKQARSEKAKAIFKYTHPCPSTGKKSGSCPGYIIDHITALACDGADKPFNMQWQTIADAKAKDKWERDDCGTHNHTSNIGIYHIGKRGGCFRLSKSGKKKYVQHDFCRK